RRRAEPAAALRPQTSTSSIDRTSVPPPSRADRGHEGPPSRPERPRVETSFECPATEENGSQARRLPSGPFIDQQSCCYLRTQIATNHTLVSRPAIERQLAGEPSFQPHGRPVAVAASTPPRLTG